MFNDQPTLLPDDICKEEEEEEVENQWSDAMEKLQSIATKVFLTLFSDQTWKSRGWN